MNNFGGEDAGSSWSTNILNWWSMHLSCRSLRSSQKETQVYLLSPKVKRSSFASTTGTTTICFLSFTFNFPIGLATWISYHLAALQPNALRMADTEDIHVDSDTTIGNIKRTVHIKWPSPVSSSLILYPVGSRSQTWAGCTIHRIISSAIHKRVKVPLSKVVTYFSKD